LVIGLRFNFIGGSQDQYDAVHKKLDVEANPPEGLLFHAAGPIDDGWGVLDFWESRAAYDSFAATRLQRAVEELGPDGFAGPPDIKEFPVYTYTKP
jgi:hypothetical protein